jgi:ATP synthase alpha/beta subunit-like protein/V/A type ATP synthase-like protein
VHPPFAGRTTSGCASCSLSSGGWAQCQFPAVDWETSYSLYADEMARYFDTAVDRRWPSTRARVLDLLQRDAVLREVAAVVGPEALEDKDRLLLPALALAATIAEHARAPRDEPFAVVFAAIAITARETSTFLERFQQGRALERSVLYLNQAEDSTIERLLAPRAAAGRRTAGAHDAASARRCLRRRGSSTPWNNAWPSG